MIDKILPCPECGDYPDFNLYEPSVNKYTISINCCCKETCKVIERLEEKQNDLISIIAEWNEFSEANQTIRVLKEDLLILEDFLKRRIPADKHVRNAYSIIKKYLGGDAAFNGYITRVNEILAEE